MTDFPKLEWVTIDGKNVPFVYPQHEKENGKFVTTGENNPLPTGDYGMTEGGLWIPKRVDDEGHTLTQLIGSIVENNIERVIIFDAIAIRDTNAHFSSRFDISKYKKITMWVETTLDKPIVVYPSIESANGNRVYISTYNKDNNSWQGTSSASSNAKLEGSNNNIYLLNLFYPWLTDAVAQNIYNMKIQCHDGAPTEGQVTVWIEGVPN